MLRRSFLKACSAVSAMSVLGGVQAVSAEQCSRTFADLYADWTLSKKGMFHRFCDVNNVSCGGRVFVNVAKQNASFDDRWMPRMFVVILKQNVWLLGRIRSEWGLCRLVATEPYHESINVLRDFVGYPVDQALQKSEINIFIPGFGEQQIHIGGRSDLHGETDAVILCMRNAGLAYRDVVLSTSWLDDVKYMSGIGEWHYRLSRPSC